MFSGVALFVFFVSIDVVSAGGKFESEGDVILPAQQCEVQNEKNEEDCGHVPMLDELIPYIEKTIIEHKENGSAENTDQKVKKSLNFDFMDKNGIEWVVSGDLRSASCVSPPVVQPLDGMYRTWFPYLRPSDPERPCKSSDVSSDIIVTYRYNGYPFSIRTKSTNGTYGMSKSLIELVQQTHTKMGTDRKVFIETSDGLARFESALEQQVLYSKKNSKLTDKTLKNDFFAFDEKLLGGERDLSLYFKPEELLIVKRKPRQIEG